MLLSLLKTIRTLLAYVLVGLPLIAAYFFTIPTTIFSRWGQNFWLSIDIVICSAAHGTRYRTISGWTGEHAFTKRRYQYQAYIIDLLAYPFERQWDHCHRAYIYELKKGLV
ncbi:hypothetical protein tloyanaT_12970 [Thalassotalea loyana]|uniref:Uncharacterized protein n=1 Tax=Thalassotalea loyana TaxID=280483 RepID=A0ABQ6HE75_9GAMM|nr:hypothetical protein [Thalassotalea loyana]GLX85045.1 hypothetical protein tloyanaT_12970 [Thalassotalea loyana]